MTNESTLALIAIIGGIAVALQGQFMGQLDRQIGTAESVFITYGLGAVIAGFIMIYLKGGQISASWNAVPMYVYTSGLLGLVIVGSIAYTVPRMGMAGAFTLLLVGQFLVAALVDHFGWFGSEVRLIGIKQSAGLVILLVGAFMVTA